MEDKVSLYDLDFEALTAFVIELGEPKFRAKQIWQWLYQKYAADFGEMTNLSKGLRAKFGKNGRYRQRHHRHRAAFERRNKPKKCCFAYPTASSLKRC